MPKGEAMWWSTVKTHQNEITETKIRFDGIGDSDGPAAAAAARRRRRRLVMAW
jgi:hypothetical protein